MTNVLIRDVPEDVHGALVRKAEAAGQSLQAYLSRELTDLAGRLSEDEWLDRVASRRGSSITSEEAVRAVHEGRRAR